VLYQLSYAGAAAQFSGKEFEGRGSTVPGVNLMDLQKKAIDATVVEGPIEPDRFAAKFSLDPGATAEALADLKRQGFMELGDDGRYSLTSSGAELRGRWVSHESAPVRRTNTW
jgi:hypothetical protein